MVRHQLRQPGSSRTADRNPQVKGAACDPLEESPCTVAPYVRLAEKEGGVPDWARNGQVNLLRPRTRQSMANGNNRD